MQQLFGTSHVPRIVGVSVEKQRLLRMLLVDLAGQVVTAQDSLQFAADLVWWQPRRTQPGRLSRSGPWCVGL
jgi:hypothetical protein